jgi:hypothetical protein
MKTEEELTANPRILEVAFWIEKGESYGTIVKEFVGRWSVSDRTVKSYIAIAREVVAERIREGKSLNDDVRRQYIEEQAKMLLPDNSELEKMLWEIAKGEIEMTKMAKTAAGIKPMVCRPDFTHRLHALVHIWKMRCKESAGEGTETSLMQFILKDEAQKSKLEKCMASLQPAGPETPTIESRPVPGADTERQSLPGGLPQENV